MDTVFSVAAIVVSLVALISNFTSNRYEHISYREQVYHRFSQMWFDLDHIFIEHPHMRKYFYRNQATGSYVPLPEAGPDYELGLSIAEMFGDVFQYSRPLEEYLDEEDLASYREYKKMITASPAVQALLTGYRWSDPEKTA